MSGTYRSIWFSSIVNIFVLGKFPIRQHPVPVHRQQFTLSDKDGLYQDVPSADISMYVTTVFVGTHVSCRSCSVHGSFRIARHSPFIQSRRILTHCLLFLKAIAPRQTSFMTTRK